MITDSIFDVSPCFITNDDYGKNSKELDGTHSLKYTKCPNRNAITKTAMIIFA